MAGGENAIIEYRVQQYRLFKALGVSYLMLWTGRSVADYLKRVVAGVVARFSCVCYCGSFPSRRPAGGGF